MAKRLAVARLRCFWVRTILTIFVICGLDELLLF